MMHDSFLLVGLGCLAAAGFLAGFVAADGWGTLMDWLDRRHEREAMLAYRRLIGAQPRQHPLGDALLWAQVAGVHRRPAPYDQDAA